MDKLFRVGIVGCGHVAQYAHIPALRRIKNAEIAAVCDIDTSVAVNSARRFHIPKIYNNLSDMLQNEQLDIVNICTPPDTHASLSIQAMESGCHVLVEKPMALSVQETDKMIKASHKVGVKLSVGHNLPLHPLIIRAKSMVANGYIGDLTGLDMKYLMHGHRGSAEKKGHWCHKLPGGIFANKLPPPLSLSMAFMHKLEPVAVRSIKTTDRDWLPADDLRVILRGENGLATITLSTSCPKDIFILSIFGTKRNLYIHLNNAVMFSYGQIPYGLCSVAFENLRQSSQILNSTISTVIKKALGIHHFGHYALINGFIESIQNNTEPPVTSEEGRETVKIISSIVSQIQKEP